MSEYMSPISTPFDMSRKKKPRVSDMSRRPFHILDLDPRLDVRLAAVLVRDGGVQVDGDHGGHEVPLMAEGDGLADERAVLELVLEELRGEGRAVGERSHVLGAVDDDEMPARIDEAGVP